MVRMPGSRVKSEFLKPFPAAARREGVGRQSGPAEPCLRCDGSRIVAIPSHHRQTLQSAALGGHFGFAGVRLRERTVAFALGSIAQLSLQTRDAKPCLAVPSSRVASGKRFRFPVPTPATAGRQLGWTG